MRARFIMGVCVVLAVSWLSAGAAEPARRAPAGWRSGVGVSGLTDPLAAGDEAAAMAKAGLDGSPAKIVVVAAAEPQVTPGLIEGVKKHFDASIIYGCQITSPLTMHGNYPDVKTIDVPVGVSVWALGGDAEIFVATVETDPEDDDAYYSAGETLGLALREAAEDTERPGRIIVTFGDQYNGSNKDFAFGLNDGLGDVYPIVGAAAGNVTAKEIVKGEIVTGRNIAFLLAGDFRVTQALNGGTHTPETADRTLAAAVADGDGQEPFFALVFNCRRRRRGMIERSQLAEELERIQSRLPGIDFFGFYGPGEIGAAKTGGKAEGVGFTVVTAVFFAE